MQSTVQQLLAAAVTFYTSTATTGARVCASEGSAAWLQTLVGVTLKGAWKRHRKTGVVLVRDR